MKRFNPAAFLIPSNSGELKLGLYISSQMPRNSMVFIFAILSAVLQTLQAKLQLLFELGKIL